MYSSKIEERPGARKDAMRREIYNQYAEKSGLIQEEKAPAKREKPLIASGLSNLSTDDIILGSLILFLLSDFSEDDVALLLILLFLILN